MNTIPNLTGTIPFRVQGQKALPKFQQELNQRFIEAGLPMPEKLRYQCRIATDARDNFKRIDLTDGETLTLHPKSNPQFGENRDGLAYLTVTLKYSGDGRGYRFRWIGNNVPRRMDEVAVAHDLGKYVPETVIPLDLAAAEVVSSIEANQNGHLSTRDQAKADKARKKYQAKKPKEKRGPRTCNRRTAAALIPA